METPITKLRNLFTPMSNYFALMRDMEEGRAYPKEAIKNIMHEESRRCIENLDEILNIIKAIPDNALNLPPIEEKKEIKPPIEGEKGCPFDDPKNFNPLCEKCGYQNSETRNTCDILNPQFR